MAVEAVEAVEVADAAASSLSFSSLADFPERGDLLFYSMCYNETPMIHTITIYSTPSCAYCHMAKEYFKKNSIAYTEHDVARDITKRQEMLDKSHQFGVPVIDIDGKIIIGFDKPKINQLLGL